MPSLRSKILYRVMKNGMDFNKSLEDTRGELDRLSTKLKIPKNLDIEYINNNGVKGELYKPFFAPRDEIIYYLHPGGYCLGIYNSTRNHIMRVAKRLNRVIFMLDYRIAPENPFPASIEDSYNGYLWLLDSGLKPKNITFYGESAGCGLLLNTLITIRDTDLENPKCSYFSTPFLDATMTGDSVLNNADKDPYYCSKENYIFNSYIRGMDSSNKRISPIFEDFNNLPPFLIHGASYDMLLCDSIEFTKRLKQINVSVELKVWNRMWHVFIMNADLIPEGKKAIDDFAQFIERI